MVIPDLVVLALLVIVATAIGLIGVRIGVDLHEIFRLGEGVFRHRSSKPFPYVSRQQALEAASARQASLSQFLSDEANWTPYARDIVGSR